MNTGFYFTKKYFRRSYYLDLYDASHYPLADLTYMVYGRTAYIHMAEISEYAKRNYSQTNWHFGTEIFKIFISELEKSFPYTNSITGTLSTGLTQHDWEKAISFYYSAPQYIISAQKSYLIFHLFESDNYENEYILLKDKNLRATQIKDFTIRHFAAKQDASFRYDIVKFPDYSFLKE